MKVENFKSFFTYTTSKIRIVHVNRVPGRLKKLIYQIDHLFIVTFVKNSLILTDIGQKDIVKVVCGALNAKKDLITVYAGPGSIIPKNKTQLAISKIRGVTSYGMLCSEAELNLSNESDGITELSRNKYSSKIGKNFFKNVSEKVVDLSITPNRPDCLGIRGIARDLAAAGAGELKNISKSNIKKEGSQNIKVSIKKEKNQGCNIFGSCLIKEYQIKRVQNG